MIPPLIGIGIFSGWMGALQYYVILSTNHGLEEVEKIHQAARLKAQRRESEVSQSKHLPLKERECQSQ